MIPFGRTLMSCVGLLFLLTAVAAEAQIAAPTLAIPAAGATDLPLTAHFLWRPVDSAAHYEIELGYDEGFDRLAWSNRVESAEVDVEGLWEETTYYWHVRTIDSLDGISDWSETRSFRTIVTGAPRPTGPADNAADLPVDQFSLNFTYPTFPPNGFDLMYAFSEDFRNGISLVVPSAVRSVSPGILPFDTVVFWRVRVAAGAASGAGPWSRVMRFRTAAPIPRQLGECTPVLPQNGITLEDAMISSVWSGSSTSGPDAIYHIQFSQDRSMNEVMLDFADLDTNAIELEMPAAGDWFWRVREIATTDDVSDGPWSPLASFTIAEQVGTALRAPSLLLPPDGARARGAAVLLVWDSVDGAEIYQAEVTRDSTFEAVDQLIASMELSVRASGLISDTLYHWRVRAVTADGGEVSPWSLPFTFTTRADSLALPGTSLLVSPANQEVGINPGVRFHWTEAPDASAYVVQISTDSTFSREVQGLAAFDTSATTLLEPGRRFWWRVRGANDAGSGAWSDVWTFTTAGGPSSAPLDITSRTGSMQLIPTPASSLVRLSAMVAAGSDARLVIVNMRGEMVIDMPIRAGSDGAIHVDLPIEDLTTGVYRCRVLSTHGDSIEAPLVISR